MKVRCKLYPNIERMLPSGTTVKFIDGLADVPDSDALSLVQDVSLYELVQSENPSADYKRFNPLSWSKDKKIVWDGHIGFHNGYGKSSMNFIEALDELGLDIYPSASRYAGSTYQNISPKLTNLLKKMNMSLDGFYITMHAGQLIDKRIAERQIGFTMFEASKIPQDWVDNLNNNCERVIVPCEHNKEVFINSGVTRDIAVIPLGVNEDYKYLERESSDTFVFSTMGTLTYRKGTDLLVKAYQKVFPKEKFPNVQLYIKTLGAGGITPIWFTTTGELKDDPRISLYHMPFSPSELIDYFSKIDCFVFPTRGEGFGLPPLEAMATGCPVICTKWSGCADFLNDEIAYPLDYSLVDCPTDPTDPRGFGEVLTTPGMQWAEPSFDDLCDKIWDVYEHRARAEDKGRKASDYVLKNFSYKASAGKLINYLNQKF